MISNYLRTLNKFSKCSRTFQKVHASKTKLNFWKLIKKLVKFKFLNLISTKSKEQSETHRSQQVKILLLAIINCKSRASRDSILEDGSMTSVSTPTSPWLTKESHRVSSSLCQIRRVNLNSQAKARLPSTPTSLPNWRTCVLRTATIWKSSRELWTRKRSAWGNAGTCWCLSTLRTRIGSWCLCAFCPTPST